MNHSLVTEGQNDTPKAGVLPHAFAGCSCGFRAETTLGNGSFNRTTMFARNELLAHAEFMNAQVAK